MSIQIQTCKGYTNKYFQSFLPMSGTLLDPSLRAGLLRGRDGENARARELWVTEKGLGWEEQGKGHSGHRTPNSFTRGQPCRSLSNSLLAALPRQHPQPPTSPLQSKKSGT